MMLIIFLYDDSSSEISSIISLYDGYDIFLGGDFKVDFYRLDSTNLYLSKLLTPSEQLTITIMYNYSNIQL